MKKIVFAALLLFCCHFVQAQNYQWRYHLTIPDTLHLIKVIKIVDTVTIPVNATIKKELIFQDKTQSKTITNTASWLEVVKDGPQRKIIQVDKKIDTLLCQNRYGWIVADKTDKSLLHINLWDMNGVTDDTDYQYQLYSRVVPLKLDYRSWEAGAITIPFRYRFKLHKNGKDVSDDFSASLNIGVFAGFTWGKYTFAYRKNEEREPLRSLWTFGAFLSVSQVGLDATNTITSKDSLTGSTKKNIGAVSPGLGLTYSLNNFKMGLFVGSDLPIGTNGAKWDYKYYPWIGFGLGFNLSLLGIVPGGK